MIAGVGNKLPSVIDTLIGAIRARDLDVQLAQVGKPTGTKNKVA